MKIEELNTEYLNKLNQKQLIYLIMKLKNNSIGAIDELEDFAYNMEVYCEEEEKIRHEVFERAKLYKRI